MRSCRYFGFLTCAASSALVVSCAFLARANPAQSPPASAASGAELKGKNLILITVDTTRADYITCYGGPRDLTPNIDALAADGTLFQSAYSQTNVTNPSHTAILTGLFAIDSRVFENRTAFLDACPKGDTVPQAFKRAGYRTAGFPATPHLSKADECLNLPGFDVYPAVPEGGGFDAAQIVDHVIEWLNTQKPETPFFAWVHFFDPHMKYWPPEDYRNRFYPPGKDARAGGNPPLGDDDNFDRSPDIVKEQFKDVRDREYPPALYRGEIKYTDDQVGRLIKHLKSSGLYEKTGVVLVADHGESLGDHDVYYDHYGMFEPSMRIPFIVRLPGMPAGKKVAETVTHVDLAPTLCKLYGVELKQNDLPLHGIDLAASLKGSPNPALSARQVTVHEDAYNRQVMALKGPWKLIHMNPPGPKYEWPTVLLFNIQTDPQEKNNLAEKNPEIVSELKGHIERWLQLGKFNPRQNAAGGKPVQPNTEREKTLKALGYMDDEEEPAAKSAAKPAGLTIPDFQELVLKKLKLDLTAEQKKGVEEAVSRAKAAVRKAGAEKDEAAKTELGRAARAQMQKDVAAILTAEQNKLLDEALAAAKSKAKPADDK